MDKAPTISREDHSSYCSAQSGAAPLLREVSRDMKQNSEDAQGSRRMPTKCKIHSGEVQRARVSSARAPGSRQRDVLSRRLHDPHPVGLQAKLFCEISRL